VNRTHSDEKSTFEKAFRWVLLVILTIFIQKCRPGVSCDLEGGFIIAYPFLGTMVDISFAV